MAGSVTPGRSWARPGQHEGGARAHLDAGAPRRAFPGRDIIRGEPESSIDAGGCAPEHDGMSYDPIEPAAEIVTPATPAKPFAYGGQALMEGVMMRGADHIGVAIRLEDGRIAVTREALAGSLHASRASTIPFLRGLVVLWDQLGVGMRWLFESASINLVNQTGMEIGRRARIFSLTAAISIAIGLFVILPLVFSAPAASGPAQDFGASLLPHLLEGLSRAGLFVGYLLLVGLFPSTGRTFRYHGAEHMTIHALEAGEALTVENVRRHPTAHPRCGTEFLVLVMMFALIIFAILGRGDLLWMLGTRLLLIPVIAGVAYELLKFLARHRDNAFLRAVGAPGIWLQMITTKQPDDSMIEVAIASLREAMTADGRAIPAGSLAPAVSPVSQALTEGKAAAAARKAAGA